MRWEGTIGRIHELDMLEWMDLDKARPFCRAVFFVQIWKIDGMVVTCCYLTTPTTRKIPSTAESGQFVSTGAFPFFRPRLDSFYSRGLAVC